MGKDSGRHLPYPYEFELITELRGELVLDCKRIILWVSTWEFQLNFMKFIFKYIPPLPNTSPWHTVTVHKQGTSCVVQEPGSHPCLNL